MDYTTSAGVTLIACTIAFISLYSIPVKAFFRLSKRNPKLERSNAIKKANHQLEKLFAIKKASLNADKKSHPLPDRATPRIVYDEKGNVKIINTIPADELMDMWTTETDKNASKKDGETKIEEKERFGSISSNRPIKNHH